MGLSRLSIEDLTKRDLGANTLLGLNKDMFTNLFSVAEEILFNNMREPRSASSQFIQQGDRCTLVIKKI